ncbi:MAG: NADH-quinone oxidoreductase subunit L [Proteobacteria bacterium]|nr:NADH-quinone oxidoreductase subunit L [Pseudomonadota bacterium]
MIQLIVFLPLLAAIIAGLNSRRINVPLAQVLTTAAVMTGAVLSYCVFHKVAIKGNATLVHLLNWVTVGDFKVEWALKVDSLTAVMLVVVNSVSALVHLYSIGYMSHDPHRPRFMAYLSLFTFFMLMLVTADNFLQLFLGWEGVGLCSYLLIGFWYTRPSANAAAIKAFVVNRVGDFGFALGIFGVFVLFGSIQFETVFGAAANHADSTLTFLGHQYHALTVICILLFIGAMGKSAQLGLHTWLPDAMEGPTPVSALIHAATMVTAGVFLVARCSPLFEQSQVALHLVTVVGALTAVFAASIALTQNDIKKVIAYSTCSQLGYMFFACGVSAYAAGVFHLMTHAFFKALLFLGAGSVIHAMSDEQDIQKMGGIWKKIPLTYAMMMIGTLAITGIPPLAGYFSKDMILESAYAAGAHGNATGQFAFWMGIFAAFMTSFYSWRLVFLTFHGKTRASKSVIEHIHESPLVMTIPLMLLAVGAVISGYVGVSILGIVQHDLSFWNGAIVMLGGEEENVLEQAHHVPGFVKLLPLVVSVAGFVLAYIFYLQAKGIPAALAKNLSVLYKGSKNKWYVDEIYDFLFVKPAIKIGVFLWKFFDVRVIDGLGPNGFAAISQRFSVVLSRAQTGYVYHYAFVMLLGIVLILAWFLYGAF